MPFGCTKGSDLIKLSINQLITKRKNSIDINAPNFLAIVGNRDTLKERKGILFEL